MRYAFTPKTLCDFDLETEQFEIKDLAWNMVKVCTPLEQAVLLAYFWYGMSVPEIAAYIERSTARTYEIYRRALRRCSEWQRPGRVSGLPKNSGAPKAVYLDHGILADSLFRHLGRM